MSVPTVLIVDDHELVLRGIRALFDDRSAWTICGEAAGGRQAVEKAKELRPRLVILDLAMPDMDGRDAIAEILRVSPETKVLVLTMHDSGEMATQVLAAGARGVVLKSDSGRDLLRAAQAVIDGEKFVSSAVTQLMLQVLVSHSSPTVSPGELTQRELEILKLLARGMSNRDIAAELSISIKTVGTHRASVMRRLSLRSYRELIQFAVRNQLAEI